jgi:hypothetical protein
MSEAVQISAEDQLRAQLGLALDTTKKRDAYMDRLVGKWREVGYLNAEDAHPKFKAIAEKRAIKHNFPKLTNHRDEQTMAVLLENQLLYQREHEKILPVHVDAQGGMSVHLTQDTTTADEVLPTRDVLPIIRRAYALLVQNRISRIQPMAGPSTYVFWLDFIREADSSNILSIQYNALLTPELGVPPKGKMKLAQRQINAVKQMMGVTWSSEAEEDARALLGLNVESELMGAFTEEFARDLFARHALTIYNAAAGLSGASLGTALPGAWAGALPAITIPARGASTIVDYKQTIYSYILQADTQLLRYNRRRGDSILAGYGMANFLQNMNTATGVESANALDLSSIGIMGYGAYAARWQVQGTEFLPDNVAILFSADPDPLRAGHVYAPYIPVAATPKIYGDYDPVTGNFQNKDAWTRNIRERSAEVVTKPYAFQLIIGPTALNAQFG